MKDTFIFDMDGVLFDTETVSFRSAKKALAVTGRQLTQEQLLSFIGMNAVDYKNQLLSYIGDEAFANEYLRVADREHQRIIDEEGIPLKPGAEEILRYLNENGYTVALATSTKSSRAQSNMQRTGLGKYFRAMIAGDMITHSKPHPDIYLQACAMVGKPPESAYAVEDSFNGVRSAHAAGMGVIMVPDMLQPTDEIRTLCTHVFQSLFDLKAAVAENKI